MFEKQIAEISMKASQSNGTVSLVELADRVATDSSQLGIAAPVLHEMVSRMGMTEALVTPGESRSLSVAEMFDAFDSCRLSRARQQLEQHFEVVALPGASLEREIREGDLMVRRGEGDFAHVAVLASSKLRNLGELLSEGLRPESVRAGNYAEVVETGARPHSSSDHFARQLTDSSGRLLNDILLLRLVAPPPVVTVVQPSSALREEQLSSIGEAVPGTRTVRNSFYVTVKGSKQGPFRGDKIQGIKFSMQVTSPRNIATGLASGKRQYSPITFTKLWGPSSAQFLAALSTNELLSVTFDFISVTAEGKEVITHIITLTDATVSSTRRYIGVQTGSEAPDPRELEDVSFVFQKIDFHDAAGATFTDDWTAKN